MAKSVITPLSLLLGITRQFTVGDGRINLSGPLVPAIMPGQNDVDDPFAGLPGDVGDNREKFVRITLATGDEIEHSGVYYRYTAEEFIVAPTMEFEDTTRYHKDETARVEILQHHSRCFITTATATRPQVTNQLERFRDNVLATTRVGRGLVRLYYGISPPIARTLTHAPHSTTAKLVRWLIERCSGLLNRRDRTGSYFKSSYTILVVLLYLLGLVVAATGTLTIRVHSLILSN